MRWSNCLVWALWRWFRRGGYLWVRRSRNWWGPHFGWTAGPGRAFWSYGPERPRRWARIVPPPLFRGRVRKE